MMQTTGRETKSSPAGVLTRAVRVALVLAICWCAGSVVLTYRDLFSAMPGRESSRPAAATEPPPQALQSILSNSGSWTSGASELTVRLLECPGCDAPERLKSLGVPPAAAPPPLLPLPAAAEPLARRWDPAGRLTGEIVVRTPPLGQLAEQWRRAGWEVWPCDRHAGWGTGVFCHKGDHWIQAWSLRGPAAEAGHCLVVVTLPTRPETTPKRNR